ncbi:MAG: hypothetical protein OEO23_01475 [Gemmatimonadota bacterium]|nr:hypothetical protein [Gemmatimonadota bacterium]
MITKLPNLGNRMGRAMLALILSVGLVGCDAIDPTEVTNPTTTDEDLANAAEPTAALLSGLRAQFARLVGAAVVDTEVVSDNYSVHGTGINAELDDPRAITPDIHNSTGRFSGSTYWNSQELRALGSFVIDEIAPGDDTATPEQIAEARFYRGFAYLILGENFSYAPVEEDGPAQDASVLLGLAVADLTAAVAFGPQVNAALARAYRLQGDAASATAAANAALAADPALLFDQSYDATSITNAPVSFLVLRALQEMQPLPRLDFLDPKYTDRESGIPVAKAEEMHLILAEVELAAGNPLVGRDHLVNAIDLANTRTTVSFDDIDERRNADLTLRPRDPEINIAADAASPLRAGLVLKRPSTTALTIPNVSATSLDRDSVAALTDATEIWHAFHLARQEIMFLEGRRMSDLGIRLPMMLREIDQNATINDGDPGTRPVVPAYVPVGIGMDTFDPPTPYDGVDPDSPLVTTDVTIDVDMNRMLTDNMVSPFLS